MNAVSIFDSYSGEDFFDDCCRIWELHLDSAHWMPYQHDLYAELCVE